MKPILYISAVLLIAGVSYAVWPVGENPAKRSASSPTTGAVLANVIVPDALSENAQIGKRVYEARCATCHGINAAGQDGIAPPLIHKVYEPSHHADESFQRAAALGVRAHHWPFGDMPAVEGIGRGDVTLIIAYVRELQRKNGIE